MPSTSNLLSFFSWLPPHPSGVNFNAVSLGKHPWLTGGSRAPAVSFPDFLFLGT